MTKLSILVFSLIVLVFSTYMNDELVLLARVSFTGTSMIAPVVLGAVIFKNPPKLLLVLSSVALGYFIISIIGWLPSQYGDFNLDFLLYIVLFVLSAIIMVQHQLAEKSTHEA